MRYVRLTGWSVCLPLTFLMAACGGGTNSPTTIPGANTGKARVARAAFTFTIPRPSARAAANSRKPQYVPATTQSLEVTVLTVDGTAPSPAPSPTIFSVASPPCTATGADYTCTVSVQLPVGSDSVQVDAFDAANAGGNMLSQQQSTFTVTIDAANNFSMTLDAVPGGIVLTPPSAAPGAAACTGTPITNCAMVRGASGSTLTATVADTHGTQLASNAIPGSPVLSAASSDTTIGTVSVTQNPYAITLTPVGVGEATITVTAGPASSTSGLTPTTFSFTYTVSSLENPYGVSVDASGNIYVANSGNNTVTKYAAAGGNPTLTFATEVTPLGLALDASGNIYVANTNNNSVTKYNNAGTETLRISISTDPLGVALDASGNIYATTDASTVVKYNSIGTRQTLTALTGLSTPSGIVLDAAGHIYVANEGGTTVTKYASTGGAPTLTIGGLSAPTGVAVDSAGNIDVANYGNNTMTQYTAAGTATGLIISSGLSGPADVAVDASGNFYITNVTTSTVQKYGPAGGSPILTIR